MTFDDFSALQLTDLLQNRQVSNREIMEATLDQINRREPSLGAFITLRTPEELLSEADGIDARRKRGERVGDLAGLPIAVKDNICTKHLQTTCASKMLAGFMPPYDATVIEKIRRADGIILGKTNMDEFAMGSSTENSAYKVTRNPHNLDYVPGGTSGGSAAAVAAHEAVFALGSDTGGSIRQPAAYCGVVGLKPTYGKVSRYGLIAYASSLDQIGTITKTIDDASLLLDVIAGYDPLDSTSIPPERSQRRIAQHRIGVPAEYLTEAVAPEVRKAVIEASRVLGSVGYEIVEVSLPHTRYAVPAYYILACAEASSNLSRYAGMLYGHRSSIDQTLRGLITNSRSEGFGDEVRRRILLGTFVLSAGYYDSHYEKASRVRTLIRQDFDRAFEICDAILSPVAPEPAFRFGEKTKDPLTMYLVDILSVTANLAGLPAISIPCGKSVNDLPLAVQLMGPPLSEGALLSIAKHIEQRQSMSTLDGSNGRL